jgi:hypothetical protein
VEWGLRHATPCGNTRRCVLKVALVAVIAIASAFLSAPRAGASPRSSKGWMVIFGSSSVNGSFGRLIADELGALGFRV